MRNRTKRATIPDSTATKEQDMPPRISNFRLRVLLLLILGLASFWYFRPSRTVQNPQLNASKIETVGKIEEQVFSKPPAISESLNTIKTKRLIAVGDLHGDFESTIITLKMAGVIDDNLNWAAGDATFVQTGDVVDRGPDTISLYKLIIRLRKEALLEGGLVIPLLGNHEIMNLQDDLRYVTEEDFASFGGKEKRKAAWSKKGWIGKYLRELGITTNVNGTVFFHAGANTNWSKMRVDGMNNEARRALNILTPEEIWHFKLFGDDGPIWFRGFALQEEAIVCSILEEALTDMSANRMVIGHTVTSGRIVPRCNNQVILIDVGLSKVYGGFHASLEIFGDTLTAVYLDKRVGL